MFRPASPLGSMIIKALTRAFSAWMCVPNSGFGATPSGSPRPTTTRDFPLAKGKQ